jgi:hypothetical protein
MHKESFIINRNALLHVSTLLGHLQGELFCYLYIKVALYSWVRMCCWLCTALFSEAWTICGPGLQAGTAESSRLQYTVHSTRNKGLCSVSTNYLRIFLNVWGKLLNILVHKNPNVVYGFLNCTQRLVVLVSVVGWLVTGRRLTDTVNLSGVQWTE